MPNVVVEFDAAVQSLDVLKAAAYRLAGLAACQIVKDGELYRCTLTAVAKHNPAELETPFLQTVADENVRETLRLRTEPVRNLILSLAFGAMAAKADTSPT